MKIRRRAFSLIELLVSIGVISILCAIAVPSWRVYYRRMELLSVANQVAHYIREAQQCAKDQQTFWQFNSNLNISNDGYGHIKCRVLSRFEYNYGNDRIGYQQDPTVAKDRTYTVGSGGVFISENPDTFSKNGSYGVQFTSVGTPFAKGYYDEDHNWISNVQTNKTDLERVFYVVSPGNGSVAVTIMANGRVTVGDAEKYKTYSH